MVNSKHSEFPSAWNFPFFTLLWWVVGVGVGGNLLRRIESFAASVSIIVPHLAPSFVFTTLPLIKQSRDKTSKWKFAEVLYQCSRKVAISSSRVSNKVIKLPISWLLPHLPPWPPCFTRVNDIKGGCLASGLNKGCSNYECSPLCNIKIYPSLWWCSMAALITILGTEEFCGGLR